MLTIEWNGSMPYLHADKGPVGFIKKLHIGMSRDGFVIERIGVIRSAVLTNLNEGERARVEVEL